MYQNALDVLADVQETVPFCGVELRDINQRGIFDDTPLILVMSWDDTEAAKLLLEAGADISAIDEDGETALHRAVLFDNADLVALLLAHNAPTSIKNDEGYTPLEYAKSFGKKEAIVTLLNN